MMGTTEIANHQHLRRWAVGNPQRLAQWGHWYSRPGEAGLAGGI